MGTFISHSPRETEAFAEQFSAQAKAGMAFGLVGDLGSGKTQFVKGFARGLGITEAVLSPTFALMHLYTSGRLWLYHIDLYRLESQEQIEAAGLIEPIGGDGIAIIEWWDRWDAKEPPGLWRFEFETLDDAQRRITYADPWP